MKTNRGGALKHLKFFAFIAVVSCGPSDVTVAATTSDDGEAFDQAFTSARATQLDFTMKLTLESTGSVWNARSLIDSQMLYTMGHLNGDDAVGRLDKVVITDQKTETLASGNSRVTYTVKLPVAWGSKTNLPTSYDFTLPKMADYSGLDAFSTKYSHSCVDFAAHDVTSGSYWYYYRPARSGCAFDEADVIHVTAQVAVTFVMQPFQK